MLALDRSIYWQKRLGEKGKEGKHALLSTISQLLCGCCEETKEDRSRKKARWRSGWWKWVICFVWSAWRWCAGEEREQDRGGGRRGFTLKRIACSLVVADAMERRTRHACHDCHPRRRDMSLKIIRPAHIYSSSIGMRHPSTASGAAERSLSSARFHAFLRDPPLRCRRN